MNGVHGCGSYSLDSGIDLGQIPKSRALRGFSHQNARKIRDPTTQDPRLG
jgi:hypothetical protein